MDHVGTGNESEKRQVMVDAGYEPLEPFPGAKLPWNCRCMECGKSSTPTYAYVRYRKTGFGCRSCVLKNRVAEVNAQDNALGDAVKATQDRILRRIRQIGFEPAGTYPKGNETWHGRSRFRCRCMKCGTPKVINVKKDKPKCHTCNTKPTEERT